MTDAKVLEIEREILRLRRSHRRVCLASVICLVGMVSVGATGWMGSREVRASTTDKDGVLHLRGLVIDDAGGHERLRLGAPLPDPLIHGVRKHRQGPISGLIINDANGNERGSFVTDDKYAEAFLSLDAAEEQQVLFLVNQEGGVNFDLYDKQGNEAAITVFPKRPRLVLKKQKETAVDLPVQVK